MRKKLCTILMVIIIFIIVSCNNMVYAASWQETSQNPWTVEYSGAFESYAEAVEEAIEKCCPTFWIEYAGEYGVDYDRDGWGFTTSDLEYIAPNMEVGDVAKFKYNDTQDGTKIPSCGDIYEISIIRIEDTEKRAGFLWLDTEIVEQYKPIITMIQENASINVTPMYPVSYKETIEEINWQLGVHIEVPSEDEQLADGETKTFTNLYSSEDGLCYDVVVYANLVTDYALETSYIKYSYEYEAVQVTVPPAEEADPTVQDDILGDLDFFKPGSLGQEITLQNKAKTIIGAINLVGIIISVITLMIIGFKYLIGSVEDRADYKKRMIPWLIGVLLLFSVTTLPNIIYQLVIPLNSIT